MGSSQSTHQLSNCWSRDREYSRLVWWESVLDLSHCHGLTRSASEFVWLKLNTLTVYMHWVLWDCFGRELWWFIAYNLSAHSFRYRTKVWTSTGNQNIPSLQLSLMPLSWKVTVHIQSHAIQAADEVLHKSCLSYFLLCLPLHHHLFSAVFISFIGPQLRSARDLLFGVRMCPRTECSSYGCLWRAS